MAKRLDALLERRLVVRRERLLAAGIDGRLVRVGQQRLLEAAAGLFLSLAEDQMRTELDRFRLARQAEAIQLGSHLILGKGEEKTGGRFKQALLADAYEAAIDAGSEQTFAPDYKSALQERVQALGHPLPEYRLSGSEGPDHRKTFTIDVIVNGEVLGAATGRAKKEAEQEAARLALTRLDAS